MKSGRGDDDVGVEQLTGFQQDAGRGDALDFVSDDRGLSGADRLQQIAVGDEGDALPPWPTARREMRAALVIGSETTAYAGQQPALHRARFGERATRKPGLIV